MPVEPDSYQQQRRKEYIASNSVDSFIVPLLCNWIESTLEASLRNRGDGIRVLDVGCGQQPFRSLIEATGADYFGMDLHQDSGCNIDFIGRIDAELPDGIVRDGTYDLVLCTEVLEHVPDWLSAFSNLASLLSPNGMLVITCPQSYQLHEEPYDYYRATDHAIRWHARHANLLEVRVERLGNAWDVLGGVLASMTPVPHRRTFVMRMLGRVIRYVLLTLLLPVISSRVLHRAYDPGSILYVANAAVLSKP